MARSPKLLKEYPNPTNMTAGVPGHSKTGLGRWASLKRIFGQPAERKSDLVD
jgi:hypothetical protein